MVSLFHDLFGWSKSGGPLEAGDDALLPRALINMLMNDHLKLSGHSKYNPINIYLHLSHLSKWNECPRNLKLNDIGSIR